MIKTYIIITLVVSLLLSTWFIERQKSKIIKMSNTVELLKMDNNSLKEQNAMKNQQVLNSQVRYEKVNQDLIKSEENLTYLRGIFNKHDFGNLLSRKPQLITNRMIKGTAKVLEDLENASN